MLQFIIYQQPSPRSDILFGMVIPKCVWGKNCVLITVLGEDNLAITDMVPQRVCQQVIKVNGME